MAARSGESEVFAAEPCDDFCQEAGEDLRMSLDVDPRGVVQRARRERSSVPNRRSALYVSDPSRSSGCGLSHRGSNRRVRPEIRHLADSANSGMRSRPLAVERRMLEISEMNFN